jgi:hypothetical protein
MGAEVYETEDGRQPFAVWVEKLSETKFVSLDAALRLVLAERGLELARTKWLKPLGEGLHEFRVRHDSDEIRQMCRSRGVPPSSGAGPPSRVRALPRLRS